MSGGRSSLRVSPPGLVVAATLLATLSSRGAEAQWVEAPGQGWVDVSVYHLDTHDAFQFDGEVREFDPFTQGHAVNTAVFVTVALGLFDGVDAWVQAPYQRLQFDDLGGERLRSGIGDTRLFLRVQPLRYLGIGLPLAIRGGVKVAVGDFAVESEVIPLGDGQRDWELMLELGHSFYPIPAYVSGWVGHRWREPNEEASRDFGDEVFFLVSAGAERGRFGLSAILEGWDGDSPVIERIPVPNASRSMLQLTPTVSFAVGPGAVKAGVRVPLSGKNLPAGNALVIGYFSRLGL